MSDKSKLLKMTKKQMAKTEKANKSKSKDESEESSDDNIKVQKTEEQSDDVPDVEFYKSTKLMKEISKLCKGDEYAAAVVYFSYSKEDQFDGRRTNILRVITIDKNSKVVRQLEDIKGMFNLTKSITKSNKRLLDKQESEGFIIRIVISKKIVHSKEKDIDYHEITMQQASVEECKALKLVKKTFNIKF